MVALPAVPLPAPTASSSVRPLPAASSSSSTQPGRAPLPSPALSDAAPVMSPSLTRSEDGSDSGESVATAPPAIVRPSWRPSMQMRPTPINPGAASTLWRPSGVDQSYSQMSVSDPPTHYHHSSREYVSQGQHYTDLTNAIVAFLNPLLPTEEEYRTKEALRRHLERLARQIDSHALLLAFGSMANGFALRNSDMDLCCLISPSVAHPEQSSASDDILPPASPGQDAPPLSSSRAIELVEQFAQLIREQTDFNVMPLPQARIPIIKINKPAMSTKHYELSCDIGFENRLALENTRLLLSYAMVDPPRLRTMVLFLKVWTKRRKLNSPYTGTLSSYGYTLMALYFLMHVKDPPVLPNLQRMGIDDEPKDKSTLQGYKIHFYDDISRVRSEWRSANTENVAQLLFDFFSFFAKEFVYAQNVISIRSPSGTFPKDHSHWSGELCIQDPFHEDVNVSRPVTKDGLYTIRGEFFRAVKILKQRSMGAQALIEELCQERDDSLTIAPERPRARWSRYPGGGLSGGVPLGIPSHYRQRASGVGGSFAFEAMARGLGQGQYAAPGLPSQAMLQPLSHSAGLTGKPARGRRWPGTGRTGGTEGTGATGSMAHVPPDPQESSSPPYTPVSTDSVPVATSDGTRGPDLHQGTSSNPCYPSIPCAGEVGRVPASSLPLYAFDWHPAQRLVPGDSSGGSSSSGDTGMTKDTTLSPTRPESDEDVKTA